MVHRPLKHRTPRPEKRENKRVVTCNHRVNSSQASALEKCIAPSSIEPHMIPCQTPHHFLLQAEGVFEGRASPSYGLKQNLGAISPRAK